MKGAISRCSDVQANARLPERIDQDDARALFAAVAQQFSDAAKKFQQHDGILKKPVATLGGREQSLSSDAPAVGMRRSKMNSNTATKGPPRFLKVHDIAALIGIDARTLRRLRRDKAVKFPAAYEFGRSLRWRVEEVNAWIELKRSRS